MAFSNRQGENLGTETPAIGDRECLLFHRVPYHRALSRYMSAAARFLILTKL
jgi:hypothetical protein